ncbi:MAG: hypothetical protein HY810_08750 [Candidatus Omnitrophica bacterium]|nr:hypothetical protein [Candidatus Omnitrophota bacterium]
MNQLIKLTAIILFQAFILFCSQSIGAERLGLCFSFRGALLGISRGFGSSLQRQLQDSSTLSPVINVNSKTFAVFFKSAFKSKDTYLEISQQPKNSKTSVVVVQGDSELLDSKDVRGIEAIIASCLAVAGVNIKTGERFAAHFLAAGDYGQVSGQDRQTVKAEYIEKVFNSSKAKGKDIIGKMKENPENWKILVAASENIIDNLSPLYKISYEELRGYLIYCIGISRENILVDAETISKKIIVRANGRITIIPFSYADEKNDGYLSIARQKEYDLNRQLPGNGLSDFSLALKAEAHSLIFEQYALISQAI